MQRKCRCNRFNSPCKYCQSLAFMKTKRHKEWLLRSIEGTIAKLEAKKAKLQAA